MASIGGNYRENNIVDIAAADTLIDSYLASQEARLVVIDGVSVKVTGNLNLAVTAERADNAIFTHRVSISLECLTVADAVVLVTGLSAFVGIMVARSDYDVVLEVSVSMSTLFIS